MSDKEFDCFKKRDSEARFARPVWSGMDVPKQWSVMNLGEETVRVGGYGFSSDYFVDAEDGVPLVKRATVNNQRTPKQGTTEDYDDKYEVSDADILVSMDGNFRPYFWEHGDAALNQRVCKIEPSENINGRFLSYLLNPLLLQTEASTGATTVKSLSINEFNHMEPAVPPIGEQRRIASVLYSVDEQLRVLHDRHDRLTRLKHGLMQDLLTGNKRVTPETDSDYDAPDGIGDYEMKEEHRGPFTFEVPEVWGLETLNNVSKLITRGKQPDYDKSSGLPVLNQKCIYWDGFRFENERYTPSKDWEKSKYYIKKGDLLVNSTGKGTVGRCLVYDKDDDRVIDGHITRVVTGEQVESEFLRYFFESELGSALLHSMGVNGSTGQVELSKEQFGFIPVPVPPLWEQEQIASILYTVDETIAKTDALIDEYEWVKRGLMQDLLSGDVRTPENLEPLENVVNST